MTTRAELQELIRNGENSGVEFKQDVVEGRALAKELVALTNLEGGRVLLGVNDDGSVTGIDRADLEEWVMQVCRDKIRPEIIPFFGSSGFSMGSRVPPHRRVPLQRRSPGARAAFVRGRLCLPCCRHAPGPEARGQGWVLMMVRLSQQGFRHAPANDHQVPLTGRGPGVGSLARASKHSAP